jgi:hypothetical protein
MVEGIAVPATYQPICTRRCTDLPTKGWAFVIIDGTLSGHSIKAPVTQPARRRTPRSREPAGPWSALSKANAS